MDSHDFNFFLLDTDLKGCSFHENLSKTIKIIQNLYRMTTCFSANLPLFSVSLFAQRANRSKNKKTDGAFWLTVTIYVNGINWGFPIGTNYSIAYGIIRRFYKKGTR